MRGHDYTPAARRYASSGTHKTDRAMRPLLLIQTGEAPDALHSRFGGFADWFREAMRIQPAQMQVVRVDEGAPLPAPHAIAGAVITGSAAMVTERADWSEHTAEWIRDAMTAQTPLFGVCYGHQLMAHALGGKVGWLPEGGEIGTGPRRFPSCLRSPARSRPLRWRSSSNATRGANTCAATSMRAPTPCARKALIPTHCAPMFARPKPRAPCWNVSRTQR